MTDGRRRRAAMALAALPIALLTACDARDVRPEASRRDSAGVAIVEYGRAVLDDPWLTLPGASLEFGSFEGEEPYLFDRVLAGHRFADGLLVLLDYGSRELRYFDGGGAFLARGGGPGDGPGELRAGYDMVYTDSTVGVADLTRLNWYDRAGTFSYAVPLPLMDLQGRLPVGFRVGYVLPLSDGGWFSVANEDLEPSADRVTGTRLMVRFPGRGDQPQALGRYAGETTVRIGGDWLFLPFSPGAMAARGGTPSVIYVAANDGFEISQFDVSGALVRKIRVRAPRLPLLQGDVDAWKHARLRRVVGTAREAPMRRQLEDLPYPDSLPPFRALQVDQLGRLWAERWLHAGAQRQFLVIEADGRILGNAVLPDRFVLLDAGASFLLGVQRDTLDVETVQLFTW